MSVEKQLINRQEVKGILSDFDDLEICSRHRMNPDCVSGVKEKEIKFTSIEESIENLKKWIKDSF